MPEPHSESAALTEGKMTDATAVADAIEGLIRAVVLDAGSEHVEDRLAVYDARARLVGLLSIRGERSPLCVTCSACHPDLPCRIDCTICWLTDHFGGDARATKGLRSP